jgi:hypothetical protein
VFLIALVKSINVESIGGFPPLLPPQPYLAQETAGKAAARTGGSPTPVIAGEQEVISRVGVMFLIGQCRS